MVVAPALQPDIELGALRLVRRHAHRHRQQPIHREAGGAGHRRGDVPGRRLGEHPELRLEVTPDREDPVAGQWQPRDARSREILGGDIRMGGVQ